MPGRIIKHITCLALLIAFMHIIWACSGSEVHEQRLPAGVRELEEALVESNKYLIELEEEAIDDFIVRYGWEMQKTGSGLRYVLHEKGEGQPASYGDIAIIHYDIYLITGEKVYSSGDDEPRSFTVGRGGVESGLEEGILMMRKGSKATFILPSHIAHSLLGDSNKIPKRASIIYEVELINLL